MRWPPPPTTTVSSRPARTLRVLTCPPTSRTHLCVRSLVPSLLRDLLLSDIVPKPAQPVKLLNCQPVGAA